METTHAATDRIEEQLDELLDHAQELGLLSEAERDRLTDAIAEVTVDGVPAPEGAIAAALEVWRPKLEEASRASGAVYQYAVLRFDDRNRYVRHAGSNPRLADLARDHSPHATALQGIQTDRLLTRVRLALDRARTAFPPRSSSLEERSASCR